MPENNKVDSGTVRKEKKTLPTSISFPEWIGICAVADPLFAPILM